MPDREKVIDALEHCELCACNNCPYNENGKGGWNCRQMHKDALALLKEHDEQKREWLQTIADNQLANAPTDTMDATQQTYYDGVWHGLQMAWDIITVESVK